MRIQRLRLFELLFNLTVNKHESDFFHLYYIRNYYLLASSIHIPGVVHNRHQKLLRLLILPVITFYDNHHLCLE